MPTLRGEGDDLFDDVADWTLFFVVCWIVIVALVIYFVIRR